MTSPPVLVDAFSRKVSYLRLSVTDRCDFRCVYCMAEEMTFLPRTEVLSLEDLWQVARSFTALGVTKIKVTGGEPLVRRGVLGLFEKLGDMGLTDLSLTTNGARLDQYAHALVRAGVHRVNISLDSLDPVNFRRMTRVGELNKVLQGIDAAQAAGFKRIKLNTVIMRNQNLHEVGSLVEFALERGLDITFIEEMPLGQVGTHTRHDEFVSSEEIRTRLAENINLSPSTATTGGPARYYQVSGFANRIGFISPHSHNFCSTCNRVRVSAEGRLLLCLGNEHSVDLKSILRTARPGQVEAQLRSAIVNAMAFKPERHHFDLAQEPQILRFMNATGG